MARCPRVGGDGSLEAMPRTRLRTALTLPGLCAAVLLLGSCGDGADPEPTPAATSTTAAGADASTTGTPRPTRAPDDYGDAPLLEGYVLKVSPEYATKVTQASTRTPFPDRPGGLCAEVSFEGLPENAQWFRVAINGVEVTQELTWVVPRRDAPTEGKLCYAPTTGLPLGRIEAAIVVQNPTNPSEASRQVAQWQFDVVQ